MIKLENLPENVLLGLSGGADSVALLLLLLENDVQVQAVHVNHGLRGAAADADEAFVQELCAAKDVPLMAFRANPPANPGENWAREVRYGFFRQAMAQTKAEALVLAHHQDDQAETLLLHLLRGAGLTGLTGMAPEKQTEGMRILRPLLAYTRAELRAYLRLQGQSWREDGTNGDPKYLRNAVRTELLPLMERLAPGASARLANTCALLAEDEAVLDEQANAFLMEHPGTALPLEMLRLQLPGMQKRILRKWWAATAAPAEERSLSAEQTRALHALLEGKASSRCNLPGGWHGQTGWTHIHLIASDAVASIPETPVQASPLVKVEAYVGHPGDGKSCQAIPQQWLTECTIRSRRAGDYIRPYGMAGRQSLQDYLVNRRVDAPFRDQVPLLCRVSEVLLVGGVGAGIVPDTKEINDPVLFRWVSPFPWQHSRQK